MTGIWMDGKHYRVRLVLNGMERSFSLLSGDNEGYMLSRRHERDLDGTEYSYQLKVEPDPAHREDYDAFFDAITAPVDSHPVTLPYGQGLLTFEAEIQKGTNTLGQRTAWQNQWSGLTVAFTPIIPQRRDSRNPLLPGTLMDGRGRFVKDRLGRLIAFGLT